MSVELYRSSDEDVRSQDFDSCFWVESTKFANLGLASPQCSRRGVYTLNTTMLVGEWKLSSMMKSHQRCP